MRSPSEIPIKRIQHTVSTMRKSLLASAISLAVVATQMGAAMAQELPRSPVVAAAEASAISPGVQVLVAASERSLNDLHVLLQKVKTPEELQELTLAAEQVKAQALIYPAGIEMIEERIQALSAELDDRWWKPKNLAKAGLIAGGI